jgi:hypothetical protein
MTDDNAKPIETNGHAGLTLPDAPATGPRPGAKLGNTSALRHGLTSGSDPAPYVTRLTSQFRQQVEQAVLAATGSITVAAASEIQAASEWESHRIKAKRWLREAGDKLSLEQKLSFSREAAKAASERTRHLKALCIGSPASRSLWSTLDAVARDVEPKAEQEADKPADAAACKSGGHAASPEADAHLPLLAMPFEGQL